MKLRLNAEFEAAREIAACYVGSLIQDVEGSVLAGIIDKREYFFFVCDNPCFDWLPTITIDLATAKFDPFAAMREGVSMTVSMGVFGYETGIVQIRSNKAGCAKAMAILRGAKATLNLDWARTLEGVEVVE